VKLLIVEDNPDLMANLFDYFEAAGHAIEAAYDGEMALSLARRNAFDAVVLDLGLPGMGGLRVCQQLRDAGRNTPILILTARDGLQDKLDCFAAGADDYVIKPCALAELEARLGALLRRVSSAQAEQLRVADLTFDTGTLAVQRGGRTLRLSPLGLQILDMLMRASPRVVPRRDIEQRLWGEARADSGALRVHMHALRNALDKPFNTPLLHTLHGIGYRLAAPDELPEDG
jgi:DNA-binding response OmpR family regulator